MFLAGFFNSIMSSDNFRAGPSGILEIPDLNASLLDATARRVLIANAEDESVEHGSGAEDRVKAHRSVSYSQSSSKPAAIHHENVTVNVVGRRRTQKNDSSRKIIRLTPSSAGYAVENLAAAYGIASQGRGIVGFHVPRSDRIHVDALGSPFVGKGFGELGHASFCCGVGRHKNSSLEGQYRGDVHDFSALGSREHVFCR